MVGWCPASIAYCSNGFVFTGNGSVEKKKCICENSTAGIGWIYGMNGIFITINGALLNFISCNVISGISYYPAISFSDKGIELTTNFGQKEFLFQCLPNFLRLIKRKRDMAKKDSILYQKTTDFVKPKIEGMFKEIKKYINKLPNRKRNEKLFIETSKKIEALKALYLERITHFNSEKVDKYLVDFFNLITEYINTFKVFFFLKLGI